MTEMELRTMFVDSIRAYYGTERGTARHQEILDYYNSNPNLPRGYKMTASAPWCATTPSAIAIKLGLEKIIYPECSCTRMIELYKAAGRWAEDDSYTPQPGDLIMYDWDDNGVGDNTGEPDHVGVVVRITGDTIRVIEGNMGSSSRVWHRDIKINGRYIRGYCCPDYASIADKEVDNMSKFADVQDGSWYAEAVNRAQELGLMVGVSDDKFGVGEPVTREQLAAVVVRLYEKLKN